MNYPNKDYGRVIIGFYGTSKIIAQQLCKGAPFKSSQNDYDWLGSGIYFWEYAPYRAWSWAKQQNPKNPTVVAALIRLGNCFDLLDPENSIRLEKEYKNIAKLRPDLKNEKGANYLDCTVVNSYMTIAADEGIHYDTLRGVFVESKAADMVSLWPESGIIHNTHIQLVVRNVACIISVWPVKQDGRYGYA